MGFFHSPSQYTFPQRFFTALCGVALFITLGTAIYYFHSFGKITAILLTLFTPAITYAFLHIKKKKIPDEEISTAPATKEKTLLLSITLTIVAAFICKTIFKELAASAAQTPVQTPWSFVPQTYFIHLAQLTGITVLLAFLKSRLALVSAAFTGISMLTVALFVYSAGFGFDPFLHRAAEQYIVEHGVITPKSPYYIGQYIFIVTLHHLTGISVQTLDLWLLPILTSLIPLSLYAAFSQQQFTRSARLLAAIAFLAAPLSAFIATTPQGVANIFAILAVIAALTPNLPRRISIILAVASAAIHPIVGIPVTITLAASTIPFTTKLWRTLRIALIIASCTSVPLMFVMNGIISGFTPSLAGSLDHNHLLSTLFGIVNHRHYSLFGDFAYGWHAIRPLIILVLTGFFIYSTHKSNNQRLTPIAFIPAALLANALLLISFRFPFLVATEQLNYSSRLAEIALLTATPLALHVFATYLTNIPTKAILSRIAVTTSIAALIIASSYINYPRIDTYASTRAFSTSQNDITAVRSIADDAAKHGITEYVVLANQSTSAAAVNEYGFAKYYDDIFFYPLPTSSPLYDIFLATNDTFGKREVALRAAQLTGVNTVYYMVSDYWWDARRIVDEAKTKADRFWQPTNDITIFIYTKK